MKAQRRGWEELLQTSALILLLITICAFVAIRGHVHVNRPEDRAEAAIAALSAALEAYRADHGSYPSDPHSSTKLKPNNDFDPASYVSAAAFLYRALSGDSDGNSKTSSPADTKVYFEFRREMLHSRADGSGTYVIDPWGNAYGYSTFQAMNPGSTGGNNPTFDLWSTGGESKPRRTKRWVKNW